MEGWLVTEALGTGGHKKVTVCSPLHCLLHGHYRVGKKCLLRHGGQSRSWACALQCPACAVFEVDSVSRYNNSQRSSRRRLVVCRTSVLAEVVSRVRRVEVGELTGGASVAASLRIRPWTVRGREGGSAVLERRQYSARSNK